MATAAHRVTRSSDHFINRIGLTVVYVGELLRHRAYTRFLHWAYGIFFFLALLSGFGIYMPWSFRWLTPLFGGGAMARMLHPWFGLGFVFFFGLQALNWFPLMRWRPGDTRWMKRLKDYVTYRDSIEPPDVGFFNAGQKAQFWEIVGVSIAYVITGAIMWFPDIFVHIYLSTFGVPGTMQAMTLGTVSEAWAWTHHPAWYKEVTGRDPQQAMEEARQKLSVPPDEARPRQ